MYEDNNFKNYKIIRLFRQIHIDKTIERMTSWPNQNQRQNPSGIRL